MSSFLSQVRKGSSNKASRVVHELQQQLGKLQSSNVVIEDEGLTDVGVTTKGRLIVEHANKLIYARKITGFTVHKVPQEPDGKLLTFWLKANHTGLYLKDSSKFNADLTDLTGATGNHPTTIIKANNNDRHLCLDDSGGLDLGYLGKNSNGVNSVTAWTLNGVDDSYYVDDQTRFQVKGTTTGFSVTAWIKVTDFSQHNSINRRILAKSDSATNGYALFVTSTNKAVFAVKFNGIEYKVETPATLVTDTWYFIAATFKSSATQEAKIYLNAVSSTTAFTSTVTYPDINSFPATNLQLFGNGVKTLIDHFATDVPPPWDFDTGDFKGQIRDIRIWREKILTQQEITNFNTNKVSISNLALGESHIAGFVWAPSMLNETSSFTSTSFTNQSFNL